MSPEHLSTVLRQHDKVILPRMIAVSMSHARVVSTSMSHARVVSTSMPRQVNAFAIFIAEASAAQWMRTELPLGSSFVAMDVAKLPMIVKDVFSAATNVD